MPQHLLDGCVCFLVHVVGSGWGRHEKSALFVQAKEVADSVRSTSRWIEEINRLAHMQVRPPARTMSAKHYRLNLTAHAQGGSGVAWAWRGRGCGLGLAAQRLQLRGCWV